MIWGLYFGFLIMIEKTVLLKLFQIIPRWIAHIYFVFIILIGWVFFYFTDFSRGIEFLKVMLGIGNNLLVNTDLLIHLTNNIIFLAAALVFCTPVVRLIDKSIFSPLKSINALKLSRPVINLLILSFSTILLIGKTYKAFFYFKF